MTYMEYNYINKLGHTVFYQKRNWKSSIEHDVDDIISINNHTFKILNINKEHKKITVTIESYSSYNN